MILKKSLFCLQSKKLIDYRANPIISIFAIFNVIMAVLINGVTIAMLYNTSRHTKMQ